MQKLAVFNNISLDGYFVDQNGDMSWAHNLDEEWKAFAAGNAQGGGTLLFGRVTYELMAAYWPTAAARQNDPLVAERMNELRKIVFSRTLDAAAWTNTRLVKDGLAGEVRKLKRESGPGLVVLGSGTIVSQLAREGLIDEYQMALHPIVLGSGRTMFEGIEGKFPLALAGARTFRNGNVVLTYERTR